MMSNDKFFSSFNDSLKAVSYCPVCNSRHNPVEAKVLAEKDDSHLVHIKCRNCRSAVLAIVSMSDLGASSVGVVTDLTSDDVLKFKETEPISCDDVIEVHKFLSQDKVLIDKFI